MRNIKEEGVDRHEKPDLHRFALLLILNQRNKTVFEARAVTQAENGCNERKQRSFRKFFTSLRFLGCQGLAVRGKKEATYNLAILLLEQMEDEAKLTLCLPAKNVCFVPVGSN